MYSNVHCGGGMIHISCFYHSTLTVEIIYFFVVLSAQLFTFLSHLSMVSTIVTVGLINDHIFVTLL